MCLTVKHDLIFTADRDIVCWKFLEVIEGKGKEEIYVTPYRFKPVPKEVLNGTEDFTPFACEPAQKWVHVKPGYIEPTAETGYIHAHGALSPDFLFEEFDDLCYWIDKEDTYIGWYESGIIGCDLHPRVTGVSLWRCIIPKGTKYWLGETDSKHRMFGYAAEKIRFVEEVHKVTEEEESLEQDVPYITLKQCEDIFKQETDNGKIIDEIFEYHGLQKAADNVTEGMHVDVFWLTYKPKYPEPCA